MNAVLQYASAFTGIGGFEVAFERHGMKANVHIEWDNTKVPVLKEHWPDIPVMGDICDVSGTDLGSIELAVAGFPCKDISRGKPYRQGLAGKHSSKLYEFYRLLEEYARLVDAGEPRWVALENSADLVRYNDGRDLATVLGTLEDLGYGWAYRVVDARGFGSPQRRRRILVVGHRGGDPRPAGQVLALTGPGAGPAGAGDPGFEDTRSATGAIPVGGDLVRVWRKGVRSQVAIRFHDHPTCPAPRANGSYPKHPCQGTYNPDYRETWVDDGAANTLTTFDGPTPTRQTHLIAQHGGVRALSPIEWERLMGFPDNWTAPASYSARFKALGDAVHVEMASWLGQRLMDVHQSVPQIA